MLCFCQQQDGSDSEDDSDDDEGALDEAPLKQPRIRSCYRRAITQQRMSDGRLVDMTPFTSPWYSSYVSNPQIGDEKFVKKFRLRFRCTFGIWYV